MSPCSLRQVFGLALWLQFWAMGNVSAHALPGSLLTFSHEDNKILLWISLPLEDLVVASPAFETLKNLPSGTDLSATDIARLDNYFSRHLDIQHATTTYPLTVIHATLQLAQNEHVGQYTELVLSLASQDAVTANAFPLKLTYDAIMHEVRNHRATVFWDVPDRQPDVLASFGFKATNGKQQTVLLTLPQN